jgi:hypothetical protein
MMVRGHLRYVGILAKKAFEIASYRGDGVGTAARQEMKQGFFLDWIRMPGYDLPIDKAHEDPLLVFPNTTDSPCPFLYQASMAAQKAPYLIQVILFI